MAAYNGWNGIPCHIHPMLKDITVDEWGQTVSSARMAGAPASILITSRS
jgi:hypothetical protein